MMSKLLSSPQKKLFSFLPLPFHSSSSSSSSSLTLPSLIPPHSFINDTREDKEHNKFVFCFFLEFPFLNWGYLYLSLLDL